MIAAFLTELEGELARVGVRRRDAERILAETSDHLHEAAADDSEAGAVGRFGDPAELGRLLAAELATARSRQATFGAFLALSLAGLGFVASLALVPAAGGWPDLLGGRAQALDPVFALALLVLPQVALVSGCLALAQALRLRRARVCWDAELRLLRRRATVALACGGAALATLAVSALDLIGTLASWWVVGTVTACAVLSGPVVAAGVGVGRSASPQAVVGGPAGDVFVDLEPLFSMRPVRRLALPDHPWRFALLASAGIWLLGLALGWYAEGDPGSGVLRGGLEALALLVCFAVLGRTLGLRRSRR